MRIPKEPDFECQCFLFVCLFLQNFHRTGEIEFWRAQTKPCVHQDPGERSSDPTIDWARLAVSVPESAGVVWSESLIAAVLDGVACWQNGGGCHYPYRSLASGQTGAWGEYNPTHQQKIWLKIYWSWPCQHFPHSQSLPSGSIHKSFILTHQRPHRMETAITENYK